MNPVSTNTQYSVEQYDQVDPDFNTHPFWAEHVVSIYNDTDGKIDVDFKFSYIDQYYDVGANIGRSSQFPRGSGGTITIDPKKWAHVTVNNYHEFHSSNDVRVDKLFQMRVNGRSIYDNYVHKGEGSTSMMQNFRIKNDENVICLPNTLRIKMGSYSN